MTYQNATTFRAGSIVERSRESAIIDIPFRPSASGVALETFTLAELVARRSYSELISYQRLNFDLLIDCQSGAGTHEVDFESVDLTPGRVVHVRPGQVHRFDLRCHDGSVDVDCSYRAQLILLRPVHNRRNWKPGPNVLELDVQTRSDLDAILGLADAAARKFSLSVEGIEALRTLLIAVLGLRFPTTNEATAAERIFADFEELLGGAELPPRTVAACAQRLGCSTRTLGRVCSTFANSTPKHMLDQAVALEAQRLIGLGEFSTSDIAYRLGFSELSQFSRFLTRVVGKGPAQLRRDL